MRSPNYILPFEVKYRENPNKIVQWFKTMTTNEYILGIKLFDWPPFNGKLWQRNYYEHIIRNDAEMNRIRDKTLLYVIPLK